MKVSPENLRLYTGPNMSVALDDSCRLVDCGISANTAKAQQPAELAMVMREDGQPFGPIDLVPYSIPPPLPEVMKEHQTAG